MLERYFRVCAAGRKWVAAGLVVTLACPAAAEESEFAGLIRSKTADRESYRAPTLPPQEKPQLQQEKPQQTPQQPKARPAAQDELPWASDEITSEVAPASYVAPAAYPHHAHPVIDPMCGAEVLGGCDRGCDSFCGGCDGCGNGGNLQRMRSAGVCQWFGSAEVLLMFRSGDTMPILATTSAGGQGEGALPVGPPGDTRVLFGGQRVLDDMTAGGRLTLGTWLDDYQCRSLVFRGWGTGDESFSFSTDSTRTPVIARPFRNVSAATAVNDSLVISAPGLNRTGSLSISGSSEVYGGDIALRQQWMAGLGGVVEVLYGYQHMRMSEDLSISSSTLELPNAIDVRDRFDAENEFHGGQIGLATRYREGCWSFNGLIKVAGGSVRRSAFREGSTTIGPPSTTTPEGLLVRGSNAGTTRDSTFGWVPELDATLGYRYTQNLDFTVGYHLIAMTDALQVSGMIDPQLAVNTDFPTGSASPSSGLRFDTFHVHGIHFGLQYVY
jgi:hypothetical protein